MSAVDKREKEIFERASEITSPSERAAYVQGECAGDGDLTARIHALLGAHDQANFLPAYPGHAEMTFSESPVSEAPGSVIGRYKLLEKIGEGGMAVVYMAEQTEPIRRKVALKIIKLGMDTRQVIARFEAERQALALMDHPSIAKVLDAGATETGRPYFVMELVQGVSITEYSDNNSLSTKDRLALFLQVCHAVQHAHQKGIIHRDIKPSNVMVTHHDGKPVPKVIDFGIAKATVGANNHSPVLTEKTLFTRYAHLIGTPAYMSPEQAELSDLDIDTRSDIYSLGVLLYELLTGTTPFSEEELRKAGYVEMQRVIREQEPVKPSTRIRTATSMARCSSRIARRSVGAGPCACPTLGGHGGPPLRKANREIGGLTSYQQVRGDLDWIVMKSLEKDRARRYETVSGLAEDVRRHLEHEPVLARGPGPAYRLAKFLRRHRAQVIAALAMAVVAGVAVVVLSLWNRDRLQLVEAEGFRHRNILSQAREQYAKADREAALETIKPILDSRHVGAEAQLLQGGILVDNRRSDEAVTILKSLLGERPEIAGAAHTLLARLLWESESLNAEKLKEIEEHHQKAEALLPETAEAYFLRAMTALTIKEQLAALDKALQLDPAHYESRRLRAFTYYASRKYGKMRDDALAMSVLRPRDRLAYSLRAIALRELGEYEEAIAEYDSAIALTPNGSPQHLDLATQRSEALLREGDYERVRAEAEACVKLWPDKPVFQYHLFCARTALGEYDKAGAEFQEIVQSTPTARNEFWFWATKHIFDTLEAGQSWHPADREPAGAAFLPMIEAEETYRDLSTKAHRVITGGFSARWSPDGKKLAFSLGVHGYSGVAIYDPVTKETDLLIVPGKDPRWSPDGRYIAFVRDCQALRLEELTSTERKDQDRMREDEEVWLMRSDGTEPRRLARGGWPSWGKDSTLVYYHSRLDQALYSISLAGPDAEPKRIMACPSAFPSAFSSVSPDNQRVAYLDGASLKVKDLASQAVVTEWHVPFGTWGGPGWSPTGQELCLGAGGSVGDRTGLWIYRFDSNEPIKVLDSQIMAASWAPDGTKLVFGLRPPYFELWAANLDPTVSTMKALGPGQTLDEHWGQMLRLYVRRIEADPQDAYAYSDRARYYDHLHKQTEANADMRRWSAGMSGRLASDSEFGTPRGFRRVIDMPFDCELVFSAERPVNTIPMMSVAFGQKGRCEMKLFEIPMVLTSLLGFCLLSSLDAPPAHADFTFGTPTNLGPPINSSFDESSPCISYDGRELYFTSWIDAWDVATFRTARRETVDDPWGEPVNLAPPLKGVFTSSISADGQSLYIDEDRMPGDIRVATRTSVSDPWGTPEKLGPNVNSAAHDIGPCISADGLELYFCSNRSGGYGSWDVWVSTRATVSDPWDKAVNLGSQINSPAFDGHPFITPDGLTLLIGSRRPGGRGDQDIWFTRRATRNDNWGALVNLGPVINTSKGECEPCISSDGRTLYFSDADTARPGGRGGWDLWQAPILPIVDFNGDGKVDAADMGLLVADWGKSNSVCDIGPFAWGDGVVDEKDLRVLMESLMTPGPQASDVPCAVILSWTSPSFAQTQDVYFGTSFEAVNSASRANPQGVLVSLGQTVTTYDPPGLLEYGRTYYWRVDFVISSPAPAIYQGRVLKFTTEAFAYPIKNITAMASSSQASTGPEKTVDGSGLDQSDGHSTDGKDMWLSTAATPRWIQYEFDKVYALHELWVWNSNQLVEPFIGFGAKTVKIEYSTDGTTWTPLSGVPEFAKASGKPGYTANTKVSFGGGSAKFVKLTIEKGWGATPSTGLSEVRFFYIPDRPATKP